jgi:hydroxylaminobenzene mutase
MTDVVTAAPEPVAELRHPLDPEPVRSTKAAAVLALGVAAVVTAPVVGGIIPATVGLALARQARNDLADGRGYLTGGRQLRAGIILVWIAITIAIGALVAASVIGLISLAGHDAGGQDFPPTSD